MELRTGIGPSEVARVDIRVSDPNSVVTPPDPS